MRTFYRGQNPALPGSGHRRLKQFLVVAPVVLSIYLFSAGDSGFYQLMVREEQIVMLEQEIGVIRAKNALLERETALLEDDLAEIERIARERYGMVQPNESVYMVYPSPPTEMETP
ncbi:MAG: septum formation initiator family protein [Candidatus Latescibacteria bacterium]|jgi:cell division protein FtsB|nr:septum formation initiator family protein [Candidatus Latescibacterota bacterium]